MAKDFNDELNALLNDEEDEKSTEGEVGESGETAPASASKKVRSPGTGGKSRGGRTGSTRVGGSASAGKTVSKRGASPAPDSAEKSATHHKTVPASAVVSRSPSVSAGGVLPLIGVTLSAIAVILLVFVVVKISKLNARLDVVEQRAILAERSAKMAAKAALIKVSTHNDPRRRPQMVYTILGPGVIDAKGKPKVLRIQAVPFEEK
ncbi:MAG: hypothetical protein KAI66_18295 [Lentisphaeria bacterium]|nr:hypothetical protein [Lentisphaeria bacterium]